MMPTPGADRLSRRYLKVKRIGSGSFGVVWLVRDALTATTLVMKEVSLKGLPLKEQRSFKGHRMRVLGTAWHPDSTHLVSIDQTGMTIVWDTVAASPSGYIKRKLCTSVAVAPSASSATPEPDVLPMVQRVQREQPGRA